MEAIDPDAEAVVWLNDRLGDMLAGLQEWGAAGQHYQAAAQGMSKHGWPPDHDAIIELSLKLAQCMARTGDRSTARTGLEWTVATARRKLGAKDGLKVDETELDNTISLLGMALDALALYHAEDGDFATAAGVYTETIDLCSRLSEKWRSLKLISAHQKVAVTSAAASIGPAAAEHAREAIRLMGSSHARHPANPPPLSSAELAELAAIVEQFK